MAIPKSSNEQLCTGVSAITSPCCHTASSSSFGNFILFCLFYSIVHATVDAILAFSVAELGIYAGSFGGFSLYVFYTLSALLFAKPCLRRFGPKHTVLFGLVGMLFYVGSFFIALLMHAHAAPIFISGAAIGGVGAGLLWTGQGSYYTLNAIQYAQSSKKTPEECITNFSSIFAAIYLFLETTFKVIATVVYVSDRGHTGSWKSIVFGLYTVTAILSTISFYLCIQHMSGLVDTLVCNPMRVPEEDTISGSTNSGNHDKLVQVWTSLFRQASTDVLSVAKALFQIRKLQLMVPYQICFGFSAGYVAYYVNTSIVAAYRGDGYIGLLSGISTIAAVLLTAPFAYISTSYKRGKMFIMIAGGVCFVFAGLPIVLWSDQQLSSWPVLVLYFVVHGAARGVWESTNKSVIADYFADDAVRDAAFGAVYFTSGLSGALGYMCYQYMNRFQMAVLNVVVPMVAILCYVLSRREHGDKSRVALHSLEHDQAEQEEEQRLRHMRSYDSDTSQGW